MSQRPRQKRVDDQWLFARQLFLEKQTRETYRSGAEPSRTILRMWCTLFAKMPIPPPGWLLQHLAEDYLALSKNHRSPPREIAELVDCCMDNGMSAAAAREFVAATIRKSPSVVKTHHLEFGRHKGQAGRPKKSA